MNGLIRAGLGLATLGMLFGCDVEELDEPRDGELVIVSELGPASEEQPALVEDGLVTVWYADEDRVLPAGCSASAGSCSCDGDYACGSWTDDDGHDHALCYDDTARTVGMECFSGGGACSCTAIPKKVEVGGIGAGGI